jgi:hypothetical protein
MLFTNRVVCRGFLNRLNRELYLANYAARVLAQMFPPDVTAYSRWHAATTSWWVGSAYDEIAISSLRIMHRGHGAILVTANAMIRPPHRAFGPSVGTMNVRPAADFSHRFPHRSDM